MIKPLCLLLVLAMMFTVCSCSFSKEIQLTAENIEEYLIINGQYSNYEMQNIGGFYLQNADFIITVDPRIPGAFYNVSIMLKVKLSEDWYVMSTDPAYSGGDEYLTTTIILPADGSKEETHRLQAFGLKASQYDNRDINFEIISVTGTFIPTK